MSVRGPLFAGAAMELFGGRALYGFCAMCAVLLGWLVRDGQAAESCAETAIP